MDAVSEVKSRLNIEDVVSEYVQLKRTGRNYKGKSPWTNEKTPSFIVSPEKQIWHDFSSGKGGDIFSFVMEMEGLDFKGTLEILARKAGVELDQFQTAASKTNSNLKNSAYEILELAAKFYQKQLIANRPALEYLAKQRGLKRETILAWRLGYAPSQGRALTDFLTKQGYTTEEMKRAGLLAQRARRDGDMFRGRIMVPLANANGQIIGFTARLLADAPDAPKYINTPQTVLYDKSRHVFGLHLAKEMIRKTGFAVVVEGNLDVIASWQVGVSNVVASAGTAMTEYHLRELKRFTGDIRLSFDADRAGIAATERAIPLAQKVEVTLRIITISGAKDPDELVRQDPAAWQKAIETAVYATDWLVETYKNQLDLTSAAGKAAFTDALLPTVRRLNDPVAQEHYLKLIAQTTDTSLEAVKAKLETRLPSDLPVVRLKKPKLKFAPIDPSALEYQRLQNHLLAMTLMQPNLRYLLKSCRQEYFSEGPSRQLYDFIQKNPSFKGDVKVSKQLQAIGDYVKIIVLQFEELYAALDLADLKVQAESLVNRLIDRYVKIQKHALALAMDQASSEAEIKQLVRKADKLNELIEGGVYAKAEGRPADA